MLSKISTIIFKMFHYKGNEAEIQGDMRRISKETISYEFPLLSYTTLYLLLLDFPYCLYMSNLIHAKKKTKKKKTIFKQDTIQTQPEIIACIIHTEQDVWLKGKHKCDAF